MKELPKQHLGSIVIAAAITKFSQLPVVDENKRIVGVFSHRSLGERIYKLQDKIALSTLPVSECLEPAKFLGPDDYTYQPRKGWLFFGKGTLN